MKTARKLVISLGFALASLFSIQAAQADALQGVLAQTYGMGGANTGWITQSQLMGFIQSAPASWSGQTYDCSLNTCLNFPTPAAPPAFAIGTPTSRTLSVATAYQATTSTKPAVITVNLSSIASLSLTSGTTNTAIIVIGATTGVASGTGTTIGTYTNSLTGSLAIALNVQTQSGQPLTFVLPAGWYFAILQQTGTVTVSTAFDQAMG